jgi:hypothetical protein
VAALTEFFRGGQNDAYRISVFNEINGKLVTKRRGPAPDSTMRPIRGITPRADINVENLKQEISTKDRRRKVKPSLEQV